MKAFCTVKSKHWPDFHLPHSDKSPTLVYSTYQREATMMCQKSNWAFKIQERRNREAE